ncbi:unnamed protein product [Adineta ricciae]|uniref:Uncharacterized protein n=1 Tax=Adineta ricciae TaxID=249248 RepID=A0A815EI72_ADIRI|nr:unnamed protein product [Adineta ricciae]
MARCFSCVGKKKKNTNQPLEIKENISKQKKKSSIVFNDDSKLPNDVNNSESLTNVDNVSLDTLVIYFKEYDWKSRT